MHHSIPFIDRIIALHSITLKMADQPTEMDVYRLAVEQTLAQLDFDRVAIFLVDDDPDIMLGTWGTGPDGQLADESHFRVPIVGHSLIYDTLSRRDIVAVNEHCTLLWCDEAVGTGWNAMVAMWQEGRALGWINADNLIHKRPFTDEDREVLKLLAASVGQMIQRLRAECALRELNHELEERVAARTRALQDAHQQMEVLARTDPLTGLANRREFNEALNREWHRALRYQTPLSLLVIDVDYFKQYNDTLGHTAGDECLIELARLMQSYCQRATDLATRYGGEEFVILLPDTNQEDASALGESLLKQIRAARIHHPDSAVADHVTVSIGLATQMPGQEQSDLLDQADRALYQAKHQGRNRLVLGKD